jgi:phosphonate transport system substrate-binding protein
MGGFMKKNIIVFSMFLSFFACSRNENKVGLPDNPLVIGFSSSYFEKLTDNDINFLENYFSKDIGLSIKIKKFANSVDLIKDIGASKVDSGILTLNEYFIARQDYKVIPILQAIRGKNEKEYYADLVVLSSNKDINSFNDLKGKKIASRDPYSISGFILPSIFLVKAAIKPEFVFTGSHQESLKKLEEGSVDAASVYEHMVKGDKKFKVIQIMGPVPNEPWICRKNLRKDYCQRIENAVESLNKTKEGREILLKMADIKSFDKVSPQEYKELYEIIYNMGKDIYSLVPDSVVLKKINEPYYFD